MVMLEDPVHIRVFKPRAVRLVPSTAMTSSVECTSAESEEQQAAVSRDSPSRFSVGGKNGRAYLQNAMTSSEEEHVSRKQRATASRGH